MSLLCEDDWTRRTSVGVDAFNSLFQGNKNIDISEDNPLILSATTLGNKCYKNMFNGCTALTRAPIIMATTMATGAGNQGSCNQMFKGCTKLSYVKCLATTNIGSSKGTLDWLSNVSATGTFVKAPTASWSNDASGIPSGWTVETATE